MLRQLILQQAPATHTPSPHLERQAPLARRALPATYASLRTASLRSTTAMKMPTTTTNRLATAQRAVALMTTHRPVSTTTTAISAYGRRQRHLQAAHRQSVRPLMQTRPAPCAVHGALTQQCIMMKSLLSKAV